jgi:hypothetical protein
MTLDIADRTGAFVVLGSLSWMREGGTLEVLGMEEAGAGLVMRPGRKSECLLVSTGRGGLVGAMGGGAVFDELVGVRKGVVIAWVAGW